MRARLEDVARQANVHPATASRALNERTRHRVSPDTLNRVLAVARELNYLPNSMARSLASARSYTIGVIVGDLAVPLFADLLRGIDDVATVAGYSTLIVDTANDRSRELTHLRNLAAQRVDGLVVTTNTLGDPDESARFTAIAPTINLLRASEQATETEVVSNDESGMRQIVDHLVSLGHTRIAHIAGPPTISTAVARLRGYRIAMLEHGLVPDDDLIVTVDQIGPSQGRTACGRLVENTDCTAITGFNDLVTFGVLKELRARKIACPDDISVAGYSDIPAADLVHPALTTVSVDHYEMGAEAARLLLRTLDESVDHHAASVRFPVHLVVRESTGPVSAR
ncbi:LacI family DNA-binding transcriptional regulator [Rhodococcoides fascians]|uniref:LacI family DNA-binding transcriptional regulator n=1 Tax=Rhodococcoides fascians TaxID=1828 RepID=UPI00055ECAA6|nr:MULTISPECIES: LacI family DNA-binding transcriptional regulator [Rhodococcus]OZF01288.1 LacI family transcriptional regulator [Rhodococcus sp. 15-1189-1-1a]OZF15459.1 LacI family transcriptional regulator [Rhodococcus sp. 14-2686-1-2]